MLFFGLGPAHSVAFAEPKDAALSHSETALGKSHVETKYNDKDGSTTDRLDGSTSDAESNHEDKSSNIQFSATARLKNSQSGHTDENLARSIVNRKQLEERLPHSAPDALRYEPGVYIQQTAHGQASPYVRGMTGQQVVHIFDGIRMNNGIYRQGPNQYFFMVDTQTIEHLEVIRGSASTRFGSDALGGVILAYPVEPYVDAENQGLQLHPTLNGKFGSADLEYGGRVSLESQIGSRAAALTGVGFRNVGLLESAGPVYNPGKEVPQIPRFKDDGRTQLGTGFDEATINAGLTYQIYPRLRLEGAFYNYQQMDAPRTDQCPPPEAPESECLMIDSHIRRLTYLALRGDAGKALRDVELTLSWQNHNEQRTRDRPRSFVEHRWRDNIDTIGASFRASTFDFALAGDNVFKLQFGADAYRDGVQSSSRQRFTDLDRTIENSRGRYIDGSSYLSLGAFTQAELSPFRWLTLSGGGRASVIGIRSGPDAISNTSAVSREWFAAVGRGGIVIRPFENVLLAFNLDQGFRAPNLDDLTSRQQTGPGFQFENPDLHPERTDTFEIGILSDFDWLTVNVWTFATILDDGIIRSSREAADCPPQTPSCEASWSQYELINADRSSLILGTDGELSLYFPYHLTIRSTVSYAWGEGPNTGSRQASFERRVPLSRIPPLNGTIETLWRHIDTGIYGAVVVRWALAQRRLAPFDLSDARIPVGGTPGYTVLDLRTGLHYRNQYRINLVLENVFDVPYRIHGSSVNGPGIGVIIAGAASW